VNQSISRNISSNQSSIHEDLEKIVLKHILKPDKRPISEGQKNCFEAAMEFQKQLNLPFIFDTGCGTGDSSYTLALANPEQLIIGIDQSGHRLQKSQKNNSLPNLLFVQARLEEFWLQSLENNWLPEKQYFFYPNPWPKKKHLLRRWHGHPILPILLKVCPDLELRTNWKIYAEEFQLALSLCGIASEINEFDSLQSISAFEEKYQRSGHPLFQLKTVAK
jgi:tRNA G46 methylase TrmB